MTMSRAPRPAPTRHSAIAAALPSLSIATGSASRSLITSRKGTSTSGMFTDPIAVPVRWSIRDGMPKPAATTLWSSSSRTAASSPARSSSSESSGVGYSRWAEIVPSLPTRPARIFVPPTSTPITLGTTGAATLSPPRAPRRPRPTLLHPSAGATIRRRMPPEEKPYRLYRGGRVKGKVPAARPERPGFRRPRINLRPNRRWLRWLPVLIGAFLLLIVVWALVSYFQFRDGVSAANRRLSPRVEQMLDKQRGHATNMLLLGTDHAQLSG